MRYQGDCNALLGLWGFFKPSMCNYQVIVQYFILCKSSSWLETTRVDENNVSFVATSSYLVIDKVDKLKHPPKPTVRI